MLLLLDLSFGLLPSSSPGPDSLLRDRLWEEDLELLLLLLDSSSSKSFSSSGVKAIPSLISPELMLLLLRDLLCEDLERPLCLLLLEASSSFSSSWVGAPPIPPPFSPAVVLLPLDGRVGEEEDLEFFPRLLFASSRVVCSSSWLTIVLVGCV